ncbi:MAG TPA: hypothetical protein IAC31_07895 [Candidatus Faecousia intestinigallinarum]|nr:hypothetical protein [Candidatus Faecousia intestinigallinarum]
MSKYPYSHNYSYKLNDGRTVLSPKPLDYATYVSADGEALKMDAIRAEDARHISVLSSDTLAYLLQIATDGGEWEKIKDITSTSFLKSGSIDRARVVLSGDQVYLLDGTYIPLDEFMIQASKEEMAMALWDVAMQAALAQMALAQR